MTADPSNPATASVADAYPPPEIAARVCKVGLAKVNTAVLTLVALAVLAGAFISLGALFYTVTITAGKDGPTLPFGLLRLAGGMTFSLGLVLVVVGGAELFTGNNLIAMAWAAGCVQTRQVVRNWIWVYLGNLLGINYIAFPVDNHNAARIETCHGAVNQVNPVGLAETGITES